MLFYVDIVRYKMFLRKLERHGIEIILSDRYYFDNLVNITFLKGKNTLPFRKIPRPTISFYLRVKPEEIMNRKRAPKQVIQYLEKSGVYMNKRTIFIIL